MARRPGGRRQSAFTLLEMLVVAAIIAAIALVAVPVFTVSDAYKLDLAASDVAEALRFARDESMRTGVIHSVRVGDDGWVEVRQWDISVVPKVQTGVARNPLTRQPYSFNVTEDAATRGVLRAAAAPFSFDGVADRSQVLFGTAGQPLWVQNSGTVALLTAGQVVLELDEDRRAVVLAPVVGRVTVEVP